MANVKQIKINDTVYDVEDSVARSALEQKAPLESPALTGIPTAPTASNGTSTTQIATTAFVQNAVQGAGGSYTLPVASSTTLGGVKPVAKTASMTQEVGVDASGALYTEPGSGGGGTVTEADIENALGYKPIGADDVPVKSVNGQTGETKTNWYFNVTGSVASPTTTQTVAQIVAAQAAGFAPICSATFSDFKGLPATLPALVVSSMVCVFGGIGSTGGDAFYLTVMIDGAGTLTAKTGDVASKDDIPTIPTELKNPYSLNIKIGNVTTSYDGSAAKTVEIPKGVPSVTTADNGKILRVVNGAWTAAELLNAGGVSF